MTRQDLRLLIREAPGHNRCDLTLLFANAEAFAAVITALAEPFRPQQIDAVAALDATGFALGGAVAAQLSSGLVLLRKPGKAAWATQSQAFVDYKREPGSFHLVVDAISPGQRILIVDDWSETGAQAFAAIQLLKQAGALVVGAAFINLDARVRNDPRFAAFQLHAILDYDDPSLGGVP